jgi:hypothetical protein
MSCLLPGLIDGQARSQLGSPPRHVSFISWRRLRDDILQKKQDVGGSSADKEIRHFRSLHDLRRIALVSGETDLGLGIEQWE